MQLRLILLSIAALALGSIFWLSEKRSEHSSMATSIREAEDMELETPPFSGHGAEESDERLVHESVQNQLPEVPIWKQVRDGDLWKLITEHWPKAKQGVADSQYIVYSIMNTCVGYRKRFEGKHLAEVQAEYSAFDDPELFLLNAKIWKRCGRIYESWGRFQGWRSMLEAAASNGQPIAMVLQGGALAADPKTFEEGIRLIETALLTRNAFAVGTMSAVYGRSIIYGRSDVDQANRAAWVLAACKLGLDCSVPVEACGIVPCGIRESAREVLTRELGDGGYYIANQKAERIYEAIASGDIAQLDIAADLR